MITPAFILLDAFRRQAGRVLDAAGFGPIQAPFRIVAQWPGARLRAYQPVACAAGPILLIIAAPIKRAYVWDMLPEVSAVRQCLRRGLRVYLLEWLDPGPAEDVFGLSHYAHRLPLAALDAIAAETACATVMVAGHSLGGTLAAVFASVVPDRLRGLVLLDAPLAFSPPSGGRLACAVATLPHARLLRELVGSPVPGSFLGLIAAAALPEAFVLRRWGKLAGTLENSLARAVDARLERWALDECALPGALFEEVVERLYRNDSFCAGTLDVGAGSCAGAALLRCPVIAVVHPRGLVVPPDSMLTALGSAPGLPLEVLRHEGEGGSVLEHLDPLVAPVAHRVLWPSILDWVWARWGL